MAPAYRHNSCRMRSATASGWDNIGECDAASTRTSVHLADKTPCATGESAASREQITYVLGMSRHAGIATWSVNER